ncbi:MAG: hypothetical protein ACJ8R9_11170 [Steroidobacteraceae bacterium]
MNAGGNAASADADPNSLEEVIVTGTSIKRINAETAAFACTYGVLLVCMLAECMVQEARPEEAHAPQRSHAPLFAQLGSCHGYLIDW